MEARAVGISLCIILCFPIFSPAVLADWESDSWLSNIIGPERLSFGDEFGCQGLEGIDATDEMWAIGSCKEYLMDHTNASRWGETPISFGLDGKKLDTVVANELVNEGFQIVGDTIGQDSRIQTIEMNGGSLEKKVANVSLLQSFEENTLVSIEWIARIHDLRVREDKDAISWLEGQPVWFTTWGEWKNHNSSSNSANFSSKSNQVDVWIPENNNSWKVPGTVKILFAGQIISVLSVCSNNLQLPEDPCDNTTYPRLSIDSRHLEVGWRSIDGGLIVTINPGERVSIELSAIPNSTSIHPMTTFNGLHHSVTIVGMHTTNLFQWSSDFIESPLRFTWLLVRPSSEEFGLIIPVIAISTLIATPLAIRYLLKRDDN